MVLGNQTSLNVADISNFILPITMTVSALGIIGNGLVIWFLSFKIRRNSSTVYILNLAVADLCFLLVFTTLNIISLALKVEIPLVDKLEYLDFISTLYPLILTCLFGYNTSLCLLTAISVERSLSVLFPIWYHCNRPRHLSSVVCISIWTMSCLLTILEFCYCYKPEYISIYTKLNTAVKECNIVFTIICCISYIAFIPLMTISSFVLLIKVCASSQQKQPPKLYIVITVTVIFFLVFGMPMRIFLLVWYKQHIFPPLIILNILSLFSSMNCSINPFVYFLVGRQGRSSGRLNLVIILQRVFRDDGIQLWRQQKKETPKSETMI
ncbi:hypothetical protein XELAEV_18020728mg [Xenopus laevis]|nr:hypothetical protein XELAEV_18020728mg [Xenopus laevis]